MKQFIYGALSAFSVVAAYHLIKKMNDKKKTSVTTGNSIPDRSYWEQFSNRDNKIILDRNRMPVHGFILGKSGYGKSVHPDNEVKIKPKLFSFNKEYIDKRKGLITPSGLVLISSRKKGIYYFKHEIESVLQNTDDKVVIFDTHQYFKPVITSLGADYTELSSDELQDDIIDKYEYSLDDINAKRPNIAPLTERITCFNVWKDEDLKNALRYIYIKARLTPHSDSQQRIWLYIPSWEVASYHSDELLRVMQRSRMAGIITTASSEIDDIIINDKFRYMVNSFEYLAFTDDIDNYHSSDSLKDLICRIDKAYQFDINVSESEENELKSIIWKLE